MREARRILEGVEAFYHLSNEIRPDFPDLREIEQEALEYVLFDAAGFCHIEILAYSIHRRGYGMLVKTPKPYDISGKLLERQAIAYFGKQMNQSSGNLHMSQESEALIAANSKLGDKLFNLQEFAGLYGKRFSRFYNGEHDRKGQVWKQRFRSYVVENKSDYLVRAIAYIHTRPVVMDPKTKLSDHRRSSWLEALEGNRKWRKIYKQVSGKSDWRHARSRYDSNFDAMVKRINKPYYGSVDPALVDAYLSKNRMIPQRLEDRKKRWQTMYYRVKEYAAKNGHFLFPRNSEEYRDLAKWVRDQRQYYARGSLSEENIDALDNIGFPWKVRRAWMKKYAMLKAHSKAKGDLLPPYHNKTIVYWINNQRGRRRKGLLSARQIELLDAIAFPWEVV